MAALCRDCLSILSGPAALCAACGGRRVLAHDELFDLTIAHVDCDAFYASVEKRDRPELATRPVIIGGGVRGVVSTACYIARLSGVHSAMPMFKALKACPQAVVIRPDFAKYTDAARRIRTLMAALTPLVQPLSIDEAVLDLSGTAELHRAPPAVVLARLALAVEREVGVTISIGLAPNRLLAKMAAGWNKPRGFAVIGAAEAASRLAPLPVGDLPGVGPAQARRLAGLGLTRVGQIQALDARSIQARLGPDGPSLLARALGQDARRVDPARETRSVSAETTFNTDLADAAGLEQALWPLAEKLARRLREQELAAGGIVLKLKTAAFALRTRSQRLANPTLLPDLIFEAARTLLARELDGTYFRLIGIGAAPLRPAEEADRGDLVDRDTARMVAAQGAIDRLRARFGAGAIAKGRTIFSGSTKT